MQKLSTLKLASVLAVVTFIAGRSCLAQQLKDLSISPTEATANSVFLFKVTWESGGNTLNLLTLTIGKSEPVVCPTPESGTPLEVKVSGGLGLMDETPCPDPAVKYSAGLRAKHDPKKPDDWGKPDTLTYKWTADYFSPEGEPGQVTATGTVKVYDSFQYGLIDKYGGIEGDRDFLIAYPFQWPNRGDFADPLHVTPYVEQFPDDGTSSSDYIFRVHYIHSDDRAPVPWLEMGASSERRGVVLYLGQADVPEPGFKPYFMYSEDALDVSYADDTGVVFIRRVLPIGETILKTGGDHWITTWPRPGYMAGEDGIYRFPYYVSLAPGVYHYFFACSDDDISEASHRWEFDDQYPYWPANGVYYQSDPFWGHTVGLNETVYLDKVTYFPGQWFPFAATGGYQYDSWEWDDPTVQTHPMVNPGLKPASRTVSAPASSLFTNTL